MGEIVNPYIAGAPVTEQRMFFGREDIFQWIENSIAGQFADHILVIHGQRRVGKTSVLKQLGNRLPARYIPVFFDLQGRTHTSLDHFLWWLARETVRVLKQDRDIEIPSPQKDAFATDPELFENQFLTSVRTALGNNTLLLTFDEFDNLEESEVKEELARPLVDHLRRLMGQPNLNFIFSIGSSGRKLENMQAAYTEFFKAALYKKISFLSEEQTHNLVTRPVEGVIEYERAAVDRIYRITSGHPYFTQLTCHELFARCQRTEQRKISVEDVEAVLDDVVERGTVNLKFVWDEASDIEKWSLAALAQLEKADNRALADYLRKNRVRFSESDLTSGLLHLREKDVLTPQNRFVIHLLRIWLQKNRPIEQAREELTEANPIANRFIEIGLEFRDNGQYEKAIEYFRQALSVSADNIQAQVNIALTYSAQGLLEQAVTEFEKALVLDDEDVAARAGLCETQLALGDTAMQKGRWKDASKSYLRVLAINEEHTEARQRMAEIARQRAEKALTDGRDEEALSAFAEALKYTPEDKTLSARVDTVQAEKKDRIVASILGKAEREVRELNWEGAVCTLEEALALSPEDSQIQKRLGAAREKAHEQKLSDLKSRAQGFTDAEKFEDALKAWREYLSLNPGEQENVEEEIVRINSSAEIFELYTNAGRAITAKNFDEAVRLLKEVINRDESYKDASRLLTKAIEARRTAPRQKQVKPQKEAPKARVVRERSYPRIHFKRNWLIGGLLVILILGIGGGLFWFAKNGQLAASAPTVSVSQTALPLTLIPTTYSTTTTAPSLTLQAPAFYEPILEYVESQPPTFEDDFSTAKQEWGTTWGPSLEGWKWQLIAELHRKEYSLAAHDSFNLPNDNVLVAENFVISVDWAFTALEFVFRSSADENNYYKLLCDHDGICNLFQNDESMAMQVETGYFDPIPGSTDYNFSTDSEWAAIPANHFQFVVYNQDLAIFVNGELIMEFDQLTSFGNRWFFHAVNNWEKMDNFKIWDLSGVDFTGSTGTPTTTPTSTYKNNILDYIESHLPTFEDDFSEPGTAWGNTSEDQPVSELVENGRLRVVDNVNSDAEQGTARALPGLVFPINGLFKAGDFVLQFDFSFSDADTIGIIFRSSPFNIRTVSSLNIGYELLFSSSGLWWINDRSGKRILYMPWNDVPGYDNLILIVKDRYIAVIFNDKLWYESNSYLPSATSQMSTVGFSVTGVDGSEAYIYNVKFWDLTGVDINP